MINKIRITHRYEAFPDTWRESLWRFRTVASSPRSRYQLRFRSSSAEPTPSWFSKLQVDFEWEFDWFQRLPLPLDFSPPAVYALPSGGGPQQAPSANERTTRTYMRRFPWCKPAYLEGSWRAPSCKRIWASTCRINECNFLYQTVHFI